jgi:hypothetical protein
MSVPAPPRDTVAWRRRIGLAVLAVALLAVAVVRTVTLFDRDDEAATAAAISTETAAGAVVHQLTPAPGAPTGPSGTFAYRDGTWLTVVELRGLAAPPPGQRYLVFVRYPGEWVLAGAATPGPDGTAVVRSAAQPPPWDVFEVMVTTDADTALPSPHGRLILRWLDADRAASLGKRPWPLDAVRESG